MNITTTEHHRLNDRLMVTRFTPEGFEVPGRYGIRRPAVEIRTGHYPSKLYRSKAARVVFDTIAVSEHFTFGEDAPPVSEKRTPAARYSAKVLAELHAAFVADSLTPDSLDALMRWALDGWEGRA